GDNIMPGDSRRDVGAASPRVLAELRSGRRIDWSSENEPKMLEQMLGMPHKQLFDPKFGSPICADVPLDFSHHRCPVQIDGNIDINKLFDQAPHSRILIEQGLVSNSVLSGPTTNVRLFAAGIGDCWLIAALASVSWTRPELMAERIRRENQTGDVESTGDSDEDSGHADFRFDFTDVLTIPLGFITVTIPFTFPVWVGEGIPQYAGGGYIYARSAVAGELWPAVIEKAVAVWRSGSKTD